MKFFGEKLTIITNDAKKKEDSIFIIKSFIHQLYNDLSSAFCSQSDLPEEVRTLFKSYLRDRSILPPGYLTTFEFNRLEFDVNGKLYKMNIERQSMMVGFILLFRVLLVDLFKNYLTK